MFQIIGDVPLISVSAAKWLRTEGLNKIKHKVENKSTNTCFNFN